MILNILNKRTSVHEKSKAFIAIAVMILLVANMANAVLPPVNYPGSSVRVIPGLNSNTLAKIPAPYINIGTPQMDWVILDSRNPVNVSVSVISSLTNRDICGLGPSNFKVETLQEPDTSDVYIKDVFPISSIALNQSPNCDYLISLSPGTDSGLMRIWLRGTYILKLDYIVNGQELAGKTFSFNVTDSPLLIQPVLKLSKAT